MRAIATLCCPSLAIINFCPMPVNIKQTLAHAALNWLQVLKPLTFAGAKDKPQISRSLSIVGSASFFILVFCPISFGSFDQFKVPSDLVADLIASCAVFRQSRIN